MAVYTRSHAYHFAQIGRHFLLRADRNAHALIQRFFADAVRQRKGLGTRLRLRFTRIKMSDKSRIHQLWVLGTEYADKSPALSRFYLEKMKSFAERGRIKLPDALKESFCQFCGSMFLIDNCSVRLKRKRKRTRRRKGKRLSSEESSESFQEPVKRATQAKTNHQLRKDRNHVVKCCKICGKRSFTQGLERVRSGLMEEKETSMLKTPKGPAYLTSTPLGGNSSIEQSAQSSRSERKRQRCRMSTARKLQSILQAENRRKSTPATPNIHDFLSSL